MQSLDELRQQFRGDVGRLAEGYIAKFGLRHESEQAHLSDPLLRWIDFAARYVPKQKREVVRARRFPRSLNPSARVGLQRLEELFQIGGDVNPYQSKGLTLHNDISGSNKKKRTDLLWADWGIHHFHLSQSPPEGGNDFSKRADWILFCLVTDNQVGFIDVRHHKEENIFTNRELVHSIAESWPDFMEPFRLNGVLPGDSSPTPQETKRLREAGVNAPIVINDRVYMAPGRGITTAATPLRVTRAAGRVRGDLEYLAQLVHAPAGQFQLDAASEGIAPEFGLWLTPQGLSIYEKHQDRGYLFGDAIAKDPMFLIDLRSVMAPRWALDIILS